MGVTLPTFADLGYGDPRAAGTLPVYPQEDAGAQGLAVLGKGVQAAGGAAEDFAADSQRKKDKLEEALATVDLFNRLTPLHAQIAKETDPAKLSELRGQYDTLLQTSNAGISNPLRRQMWTATHSKTIAQAQADADTRNTGLGREQATADIWHQRDDAVRNAVASDDPMAIPNAQMAIDGLGKYASDYGALDPKQKYIFDKQSQNQLYEGRADRLIQQGKADEAKSFLEANRDKIDPVALERLQMRADAKGRKNNTDGIALEALGLPTVGVGSLPSVPATPPGAQSVTVQQGDNGQKVAATLRARGWSDAAIIGALNNGLTESGLDPNITGAAGEKGIFQFHPGSHLPEFKKTYGGDNSPEAQANYVADVIEKTMPGYAQSGDSRDATSRFFKEFEKPADQSAGALSVRGGNTPTAKAILDRTTRSPDIGNASAGMPSADQQLPTNAPSLPAQLVADQQPQSRTGLPSLTDAYMNILRNPRVKTDQDVRDAFATATAVHNAMEADASRAERIQQQRQKQAANQRSDQIWADVYSPDPKITASQVAVDPAFAGDDERRKRMIELINNPPGSGVPAPQSQAMALALVERIRAPEGDANKITDEGQLYAQMRRMNKDDLDWTLKKFKDVRAPGGEAYAKQEDRFFKEFAPYITKSNALAGTMDPAGNARLVEYRRFVDTKHDALIKAGKDPNDLFDPASPLYVGKPEIIGYYQPTMQQSTEGMAAFSKGVPRPLAPLAPWNPPPIPEPFTTAVSPIRPGESADDYFKRTGQ